MKESIIIKYTSIFFIKLIFKKKYSKNKKKYPKQQTLLQVNLYQYQKQ